MTVGTLTARPPPPSWAAALPVFATGVVFLFGLYGPTIEAMVRTWLRSDTYAHGILVLPISIWLIWRRRHVLRQLEPRPAPWLLWAMVALAFAWLLSDLAGVHAGAQFATVGLLVLAVPVLLGLQVAGAIAFPLAFLFFMVPFGEFTTPTMMEWTADVTVGFLRLVGIPVYREGMQFVIPSGSWSVVEACSGVRYLIASFMVGTLFAYLTYASTRKRLVFAAFALVVPVVANWLRAIMIVMLGHLSDNRIAAGVDHLVYGWLFFGVVIAIMFFVGSRWADHGPAIATGGDRTGAGAPTIAGPDVDDRKPSGVPLWARVGTGTLMVAVLATPHLATWRLDAAGHSEIRLELPALAATGTDSAWGPAPSSLPTPLFAGPAAQTRATYTSPGGPVGVHVAYYANQSYDRKLVSSQNMLVRSDDPSWAQVSEGTVPLVVDGAAIRLRSATLREGSVAQASTPRQVQVRQVLWVDGRLAIGNRAALWAGLQGRLAGRGDHAAAVTFMLAGTDPRADNAALDAFVQRHLSAIVDSLENTRRSSMRP
jgi:exosortase A